ncbi:MAG: ParB/RepB/Spo0J family partition protein, partial [Eubacteriales bacterium]
NGVEQWQTAAEPSEIMHVRLSDIEPDRDQPRKVFNEEALRSLADSIAAHGVLQPIVVRSAARPEDDERTKQLLAGKYRIISGERRWRASKLAGLVDVPVVVKELSDTEASAVMLVENLQREDLNPVEVARGFKRLIEEFGLTHEETARIVGVSRPNLTNSLRLLSLPDNVLDFLESGDITPGHARALIPLEDETVINEALDVVLSRQLSVRDTEKLVKTVLNRREKDDRLQQSAKQAEKKIYMEKLQERVTSKLGRKAHIAPQGRKGEAGKLELEYYSTEDLEALLKTLCGGDIFDEYKD